MSSPSIVIISYHFYPANEIGARRTTSLACHLAARGMRVLVVSAFGDQDIAPGAEILPGITAIAVKRPRRAFIDWLVSFKQGGKRIEYGNAKSPSRSHHRAPISPSLRTRIHKLFFRAAYFIDENKRWAIRASRAAVVAGRREGAQLVLSSSPPNSVLLAGTLAARQLRVPHIADLRDPWTDSMINDTQHRIDYLMQRPIERWVMHSAAVVTSAGATVAALLARRYPRHRHKIQVVRNGYDGQVLSSSIDTGGRLALLFAGELYLGRDPFPLLSALELMLQRSDVDANRISLTFMGRTESYEGQSLSDWLHGKSCAQIVRLLPHLPADDVANEVARATVLLNLAQKQPLSVPAKTFEHMISGREMLLLCENDSETAIVVRGLRGVNQVDPRDSVALANTLFDLYRRHVIEGRMSIPTQDDIRGFSRAAANEQFTRLVETAVNGGIDPSMSR